MCEVIERLENNAIDDIRNCNDRVIRKERGCILSPRKVSRIVDASPFSRCLETKHGFPARTCIEGSRLAVIIIYIINIYRHDR